MPGRSAPTVLLVDDAIDEREMYAAYFGLVGFSTLQAANAADGYRLAAERRPAIVITDVRLSGGEDGIALARRLKRDTETQAALIVVLSANDRDSIGARAAGCDHFVTKPCLPEHLATTVQVLLGG